MARKKHKIILADDHPFMLEAIVSRIEDHFQDRLEVVARATDGLMAVQEVKKHSPDLILMDLGMPRMDGIQAIREIRKFREDMIVLVFSMYDDQAHILQAIQAGADDYLFKKEASGKDIVNHILRALGGELGQDRLRRTVFSALRDTDEENLNAGITKLTGMELEIIRLAAHKGLSMKEIAGALEGKERKISENTIKNHLNHIYEKLGARNQAHAVSLAVKYSLIDPEETESAPR